MKELFEIAGNAFEATAVIVLLIVAGLSMGSFLMGSIRRKERHEAYRDFRRAFGRTLLLALDLLLAADIILTVTLEMSFETLGMLGLLVIIRTFLHLVLELDVTGRWPWQGS